MNLKLESILHPGDMATERLVMRALSDGNAGEFIVLRTMEREGSPLAHDVLGYWLPDFDVKEGDLVVIYTKKGTRKSRLNDNGKTSHFEYWGSREPLWIENTAAVLASAPTFEWLTVSSIATADEEGRAQNRSQS